MNSQRAAWRWWRTVAFSGASLIALGVAAFYVDYLTNFRFDFSENSYRNFGLSILAGVILIFAGCIGWARFCGKQRRAVMAGVVFSAPWAALLIGSTIASTNIHGPAAFVMILIIPATILAGVLLIMAVRSNRHD